MRRERRERRERLRREISNQLSHYRPWLTLRDRRLCWR